MKKILITICARGGSKGIPGKNIKLLNGKHLIGYSINHAKEFKAWLEKNNYFVFIELSTDSDKIKKIAKDYGLNTTYTRPDFLANDTAGKLDAIKDVCITTEEKNQIIFDYVIDLDVSAPMRTMEDLVKGFNLFINDENCTNLFSVSLANKNPYFNMVEKSEKGYYVLSKEKNQILSRQKAPKVYEMNASFYFYKRAFFDANKLYLFEKALIYQMSHESFDLDHEIDFMFLEFLIKNDKLSFKL